MLGSLKTATIIVPLKDNDGSDNGAVIERAISTLCRQYGGATSWEGKGYWINAGGRLFADDVMVIQSAMTKTDEAKSALRDLARTVLAQTDQEAVFISHADGDVEILD